MLFSGTQDQEKTFKKSPLILYESHADPITVDFVRVMLNDLIKAGYTAICLEQPPVNLQEAVTELEHRLSMCDEAIEDIESGQNTYLSEHIRATYKEHALAFEKQFKIGMQHKILLYKALLESQELNNGLPKIYGIDTGIETHEDMLELSEMYRNNDFDNPSFNRIRDNAFARNLAEIMPKHDGGVLVIMGADHFGLQRELTTVLTPQQAEQIRSSYYYSITGPSLGSAPHGEGLRSGDSESLARYPLGITINDYSHKQNLEPDDYREIFTNLTSEALPKAKMQAKKST